MIMDSTATVPIGATPESFLHIEEQKIEGTEYNELAAGMIQAILMFAEIARAFGVAIFTKDEIETDDTGKWPLIIPNSELTATGERAQTVRQNQQKRLS